jgi:hypothetical protein
MFDSALCCSFRWAQAGYVTCEALRCLRTTLDIIAGVIEVRHRSIFTGGPMRKRRNQQQNNLSVSIHSSKEESASGNRCQSSSSVGPAASSLATRKAAAGSQLERA